MRLILASQSQPRRKALDLLGLQYEVIPSHFDEKSIRNDDPLQLARKLSEAKALEIGKNNQDALIVAADSFITLNKKIYEKPANNNEAIEMLETFSGKNLEMISGLAVLNTAKNKMLSTVESCTIKFRKLTEGEIADYVARYPVTRFAGAFDGDGVVRFADHLNGNYNFQTGLPMNKLILFLRENGLQV